MKKVLMITGSMRRGGAERVISIVSNYYISIGWDVCIVSCLFPEIEYDLNPQINIIDISRPKKKQILDAPRIICSLRNIVKQEKPDAVISFMVAINIITAIACKGMKVRFFPSERNDPAIGRSPFMQRAGEWAYRQSTATIMQTKRARDYFGDNVKSKSIIIPNPVSVQETASCRKDKLIVTVGRLEKQKNHRMLLEAFNEFHKVHPDYILRIFGRGSLEIELKTLVKSLGLCDVVEFMGNVDDVHHQIRNASLFVLTSDFEGLSNALIEAMMMGLTCISTDCAGTDEIIDDGINGIIIKRGDIKTLVKVMNQLTDDREIAEAYAIEARKKAETRFNAEVICKKWKELVEEE